MLEKDGRETGVSGSTVPRSLNLTREGTRSGLNGESCRHKSRHPPLTAVPREDGSGPEVLDINRGRSGFFFQIRYLCRRDNPSWLVC